MWAKDPKRIAQYGVLASLLEVSGYPKPGNVHRTQDFT
ncbi:MAG: triphosphoribosyl-dephospho-CoA synthase, partial [Candidatus Helarchaeota archaeon]